MALLPKLAVEALHGEGASNWLVESLRVHAVIEGTRLWLTTAARLEALPNVPTAGEFVPGYEVTGWQGLAALRGTPNEIIEKLNAEINAALANEKMKLRI
jgi:tripartite-type tricarboxylate transporter receptor subunit TctC